MDRWFRHHVPSMFRRRLLLWVAVALACWLILAIQVSRLTLFQHDRWLARAESSLVEKQYVPTIRGRILDRRGRVLAQDQPSLSVSVHYSVINGQWAYAKARRAAFLSDKTAWGKMGRLEREALTARHQPVYDAQVEELWRTLAQLGRVERLAVEQRVQETRRQVEQMAGHYMLYRLKQEVDDGQEVADVPVSRIARPIGEQMADHGVLEDIDDATRLAVERLIWQAQTQPSQAIWGQVSIQPSHRREYPLMVQRVQVDCRSFPGDLKAGVREVQVDGVGLHWLGVLRPLQADDLKAMAASDSADAAFQRKDAEEAAGDAGGRRDILGDREGGRGGGKGGEGGEGGYWPGDWIGRWGVEQAFERQLRGRRGVQQINHETGQIQRIEPQPGADVQLSVDARLQARVQAILSPTLGLTRQQRWHRAIRDGEPATHLQPGQPFAAAAVVMEVATGQLLAAASEPGFSLKDLEENPDKVWNDPIGLPYVNRVWGMAFEPGSTVKPLVLASAICEQRCRLDEVITCHGALDMDHPDRFRCWIHKQFHLSHGPLTGPQAIQHSCNIFFYVLGRRMGVARLVNWFGQFGLGHPTGLGLLDETGGDLPVLGQSSDSAAGFGEADAINMGIGQGPIRATPLQMASAYAALARGGYWLAPCLVTRVGQRAIIPAGHDLRLHPAAIEQAIKGLDLVVNDRTGSGHHIAALHGEKIFSDHQARLMGKSGTAATAGLRIDADGDQRITSRDPIVRSGDHGWFILLVQKPGSTSPDYVIAVVSEYAGGGSATSGPIANQILVALESEGYLPPPP